MIASVSKTSKIVVEKSTVPVKTAEAIEKVWTDVLLSIQSATAGCNAAAKEAPADEPPGHVQAAQSANGCGAGFAQELR